MSDKKASWLFTDVPVYKEGEGKKAHWFVELNEDAIVEVKPVSGLTLWMLYRTYLSQLPDPPIVEMELEGVAAVQRTRDQYDETYRSEVARIFGELDAQLTDELLSGVVIPAGDEWAKPWTDKGRPMPPAKEPGLRIELFLSLKGLKTYEDRQMLIRAIDAISQETPGAIERAQEFFRQYVGRDETPPAETAGVEPADDTAGRSDVGDADLPDDGEAVVQAADRGTGDDDSLRAEPEPEGVPERPRRKRSKGSPAAE